MILIFYIAGIRPLDDQCQQFIGFSPLYLPRNIEFGRRTCILAQTNEFTVEVDIKCAFRPSKMENNAPALPAFGRYESAPINTRRVFVRDLRWCTVERHDHIGVMRVTKTLHSPVTGNLDL